MIPFIKEVKKSTLLVELHCGTALSAYATTAKSRVIWDGKVWTPEPTINVELPEQTASVSSEACKIKLPLVGNQHPLVLSIARVLSVPRTSPPVRCRVINLIESDVDHMTPVYLYNGVLDRSTRNPQGQSGFVELNIVPEFMAQLAEATLGMRADPSCGWSFGGPGCWHPDTDKFLTPADYPIGGVRKVNVICTIDPDLSSRKVTLGVDTAKHPGADSRVLISRPAGWWVRGYLEKDGLRISIADWRYWLAGVGEHTWILNRIPPEDWQGASMVLHPGCPRTPLACSQRNNSINFGGMGYGIPAYNPVLETDDR